MEEPLPDMLLKAADVMHWLGKYTIANALILFSRLTRAKEIVRLDDLQRFVEEVEG